MKIFNALNIFVGSIMIFGAISCEKSKSPIDNGTSNSNLKFESQSVEIRAGQSKEYSILEGTGKYKVLSLSTDLLGTTLKDNGKIMLEAKNPGNTTLALFDLGSQQSLRIPVKILDRLPALTISRRTINMLLNSKDSVKIITGSGTYSFEIEKPEVLSAEVNNGYLYINPLAEGESGLTFKDDLTGQSINLNIKVAKPVEKAQVDLTTDKDEYTVEEDNDFHIIINGSGVYQVSCDKPNLCTFYMLNGAKEPETQPDGSVIFTFGPSSEFIICHAVFGEGGGTANVTIKDVKTGQVKVVKVTVTEYVDSGDDY